MKRLITGTGVVALTWGGLQFHTSSPTDRIDTILLAEIGVTFGAVAVVMMSGTRRWSPRAVGMLFGAIGVALAFVPNAWVRQFGPYLIIHRSDGKIYHAGIPPEPLIDAARACLFVGGPLLLWGVVGWWRARWTYHDPAELAAKIEEELPTLVTETARVADETARLADATEQLNGRSVP